MTPTLASYLDFVVPFISPDLVSAHYLNRIRQISERLPILSFGSFECWLDANEPRVDFNVIINPRINEHIRVQDWQQEEVDFESVAYRDMQEKIRSFCVTWRQKDFFLKPLLGEVCEVWDITDPNEALLPTPWFYISFLKNFLDQDPAIKAEIILKLLPLLDSELSYDIKDKFYQILCSLPASIRVGAIGVNNRNRRTSIRLYLEINTFDEVIKVLEDYHWLGNIDEVKEKMAPLLPLSHFFGLALDFDGQFQPKIGIECRFHQDNLQEYLSLFTQHLCDLGLCSTPKRDAVLNWNGTFEVETTPDFWSWPDRILKTPENMSPRVKIRKLIHYVKIIYEPNKPLFAKVYPMFLRPVNRNS